MTATSESRIKFDDATVYVRKLGDGPPLLLINGLAAHTAMWETLEQLLGGFRIVEFDLPGAGQSDTPWRPLSIRRLARLTTSVMDRFGIDQADVLGYSMGGVVAQQLAADAPERIRRLVLVATTPGVGAVQGDLKAMLNIMTPIRYASPSLYVKTIGSLTGGRSRRDPAWIAEQGALRLKHRPSLRGYLGQMASMAPWSSLPILPRITHETLVVAGDDDPLTPLVNGMMLAHLLPNGRLLVVPGEGHLMPLDPSSASHQPILEFLTASELEGTSVWNEAGTVSAADLGAALDQVGTQLPPWSIANACMRRRWLRPSDVRA